MITVVFDNDFFILCTYQFKFYSKEGLSFSPLRIYWFCFLFMHSWRFMWIHWLKFNAVIIHFVLKLFHFDYWELFQVGSSVLSTQPPFLFNHFLISGTTRYFSHILYFPLPHPVINRFCNESWILWLENGT